jgi:hypothetical protein
MSRTRGEVPKDTFKREPRREKKNVINLSYTHFRSRRQLLMHSATRNRSRKTLSGPPLCQPLSLALYFRKAAFHFSTIKQKRWMNFWKKRWGWEERAKGMGNTFTMRTKKWLCWLVFFLIYLCACVCVFQGGWRGEGYPVGCLFSSTILLPPFLKRNKQTKKQEAQIVQNSKVCI